MAKKIKHNTKSREEREAEKKAAAEQRAREAAGIQDEFQAKGFELVEWVQDNRGIILGTIGVVLVVGMALGIATLVRSSQDEAASADYAAAMNAWQGEVGPELPGLSDPSKPRFETAREKAERSRELFTKVIDEHAGTGAAAFSALYAGHASMDLGDFDAAIRHYSSYIDAHPKKDPLLFSAVAGRAAAYESKGETDKAIADQRLLLELPVSPAKDSALLSLARLMLEKGDKAQAKEYLDQLEQRFPESAVLPNAEPLRARLGDSGSDAKDAAG